MLREVLLDLLVEDNNPTNITANIISETKPKSEPQWGAVPAELGSVRWMLILLHEDNKLRNLGFLAPWHPLGAS